MNNSQVIIIFDINYYTNKSSTCIDIAKIFLNIFDNDANYSYS